MIQTSLFLNKPFRRRIQVGVKRDTTARSVEYLRKGGYYAEAIEHRGLIFERSDNNERDERKFKSTYLIDPFGFADILAIAKTGNKILLVQSCSRGEIKRHMEKYQLWPRIKKVILAAIAIPNCEVWIHGWECAWRKTEKNGFLIKRWDVLEKRVTAEDFIEEKF
jgi:hypothetical protein